MIWSHTHCWCKGRDQYSKALLLLDPTNSNGHFLDLFLREARGNLIAIVVVVDAGGLVGGYSAVVDNLHSGVPLGIAAVADSFASPLLGWKDEDDG